MSDEVNAGQSNLDSSQDTESISMVEILEEENRLKADAAAVLGASDDKNCTYSKGYVPRQALYACSTCSGSENVLAGICLACSYECHEGHDLYELYTKRLFRCDCGNEKFPNVICKFEKEKDANNSRNRYGQNFKGLYCSCHRPYPDPDDEVEDDMIQCILCEDWYHGRHLGVKGSLPSDFEEMICPACVNNHDFLLAYTVNTAVTVVERENGNTQVDVVNTDEGSSVGRKRNLSGECTSPKKATTSDNSTCLLKELQKREIPSTDSAVFMSEAWRSKLCKCTSCKKMYEEKGISFILDNDDTVHAYEDKGLAAHSNSDTNALPSALSQMDRVQQVELIHGFNDMKNGLREYLRGFAENGKVVKEEDIREFFSQMQSRKRQRTDAGFQYSCK
ncbi:hypothetical protein SNE40_009256 [Patella caerulea]|uniref:UBR-type domain-containing protein n=1 Tax=Patella caerulea TaxID=87958 RepID=A0AAN8JWX9_PATCE